MTDLLLRIDGTRALLTGKPGNALLLLAEKLEGQKRWLKAGGFSFEASVANIAAFKAAFPTAVIEGEEARPNLFENWDATAPPVVRGRYVPKTPPFPFQWTALARSAGFSPPAGAVLEPTGEGGEPGRSNRPPPDAAPAPAHRASPPAEAFAVLGEVGTGKSKILIDTAGFFWCAGLIDAVLIGAPKGVHEQWIEEQIPEHMGAAVQWQGAAITGKKKLPAWSPGKLHIMAVNTDFPRSDHGYEKCNEFIKQHSGRVLIIMDESQDIKTFTASRTEAWIALSRACAFRRIATGTPISKNLKDAFSQYYFLDPAIFGYNYAGTFQGEYCIMGGPEGRDIVGNKNVERFWSIIDPHTFRITQKEADLGLPEKFYVRTPFELSPEQKHHYMAMKEDMITRMESGELASVTNAMAQLIRLQQIASGFLKHEDKTEYLPNARIEALQSVLEEREGKCVIWARFNEDIKAIKAVLGDLAVVYHGETSPADRQVAKAKFLNMDDPVRYFVANPAAGGTGLNLQGECRTVIYYSNSFDAIDRWQSEGRVHRIGAKHNITYFDLVAKSTIDFKILANLRAKKSIADLAFDDIRQMVA